MIDWLFVGAETHTLISMYDNWQSGLQKYQFNQYRIRHQTESLRIVLRKAWPKTKNGLLKYSSSSSRMDQSLMAVLALESLVGSLSDEETSKTIIGLRIHLRSY